MKTLERYCSKAAWHAYDAAGNALAKTTPSLTEAICSIQADLKILDSRDLYGKCRISCHDGKLRVSLIYPIYSEDNPLFQGNPPRQNVIDRGIEEILEDTNWQLDVLRRGVIAQLRQLEIAPNR